MHYAARGVISYVKCVYTKYIQFYMSLCILYPWNAFAYEYIAVQSAVKANIPYKLNNKMQRNDI